MDGMEFFHKLFDYDHWGNREALSSLATVNDGRERALQLFGHIVGAERIWLARFDTPDPKSIEVWPGLTVESCRPAVDDLHQHWVGLLNRLTPEKLTQPLVYRNTKGVEFKTPIQDVLMHLVMHSAYHRGQVAAAVRAAGGNPAATDYIVYVRQQGK